MDKSGFRGIFDRYLRLLGRPALGRSLIIRSSNEYRIEMHSEFFTIRKSRIGTAAQRGIASGERYDNICRVWLCFRKIPYLVLRTFFGKHIYIPVPGIKREHREYIISGSRIPGPDDAIPGLCRLAEGQKLTIYTDGGMSSNTAHKGRGGWSFSISINGVEVAKRTGTEDHTTSSEMEIIAVIRALEYLKGSHPESIRICTDFMSIPDVMNGRCSVKAGTETYGPLCRLIRLASQFRCPFEWKWVKGHSGNRFNTLCDMRVRAKLKNKGQMLL